MDEPTSSLIQAIISSSFEVHNVLKTGYLETVYQHALFVELSSRDIRSVIEHPIPVFYKGSQVGFYKADLLVDEKIIVECKCVSSIVLPHILQTKNYLKGTRLTNALIINFKNASAEVKSVFA